jgi:hypothetical protein
MPIVETTDRNTKLIWTQIKAPADCRAADRAEVGVHPASLGGVSAVDFVLPFEPNLRLREIGVTRQRHTSAPLTKLAVTNGNEVRLIFNNNAKSPALTACRPRHGNFSPSMPFILNFICRTVGL